MSAIPLSALAASGSWQNDFVNLIRQEDIESFNSTMTRFREDLAVVVTDLNRHYEDLKFAARERLGSLYNEGD